MGDLVAGRQWASQLLQYLPRLGGAILVYLLFWLLANGAQRLINRLGRVGHVDQQLVALMGRVAKATLLVFGAITALGTTGMDVTALVAGLGLSGFALGFALKDIVSNVLSGVLIIVYQPFRRGDRIIVTGLEGTVVDIDLRYTVLDGGDKRIYIPNSNLFSNPVIVQTAPAAETGSRS